jgi:hypothetical protein
MGGFIPLAIKAELSPGTCRAGGGPKRGPFEDIFKFGRRWLTLSPRMARNFLEAPQRPLREAIFSAGVYGNASKVP